MNEKADSTIELLNETQYFSQVLDNDVIPFPHRMMLILLSCLLLVLGSTLYRINCPSLVQYFSETAWVEEHGKARLQYYAWYAAGSGRGSVGQTPR